MKLTRSQGQLMARATNILETTELHRSLRVRDVPVTLLQNLMSSEQPDLAMMGCYMASRVDKSVNLSPLGRHPAAARNYARFLLAQRPVTEVLSGRRPRTFLQHANQLAKRIVAAAAPSTQSQKVSSMTIIVHGTWAATSPWWQKGGTFWNDLNSHVNDLYSGSNPFSWSGNNSHGDRVAAAQALVNWVALNPTSNLRIIAHSHGGNVCFLAGRLGLRINKLITLGTPIRLEYLPDLRQMDNLHNVFSTADMVQTPAGTIPNRRGEGRTLGETLPVLNHRVTDDGAGGEPGHTDLHEPPTWTANDL